MIKEDRIRKYTEKAKNLLASKPYRTSENVDNLNISMIHKQVSIDELDLDEKEKADLKYIFDQHSNNSFIKRMKA